MQPQSTLTVKMEKMTDVEGWADEVKSTKTRCKKVLNSETDKR